MTTDPPKVIPPPHARRLRTLHLTVLLVGLGAISLLWSPGENDGKVVGAVLFLVGLFLVGVQASVQSAAARTWMGRTGWVLWVVGAVVVIGSRF